MIDKRVQIGIIGLGTVGTGWHTHLLEQKELLKPDWFNFSVEGHFNLIGKERNLDLTGVKCTANAVELLDDPDIDIIVETVAGMSPHSLISARP